jgi:hypothetical protein
MVDLTCRRVTKKSRALNSKKLASVPHNAATNEIDAGFVLTAPEGVGAAAQDSLVCVTGAHLPELRAPLFVRSGSVCRNSTLPKIRCAARRNGGAMVLIQDRMRNLANARTVRRAFRLYDEGKNEEASSLISPISRRDFRAALELIIEEAKTAERDARKASVLITELDQRLQQEGAVDGGPIKSSIA